MEEPIISIVVPVHNEEENIPQLFSRIRKTLVDFAKPYEIIFVNDASYDRTENLLDDIYHSNKNVVVINLFKRSGKAIALERGFEIIRGKYIVIIDADLQHDPEDIPKLVMKMEEGYDVVTGKRVGRQDSLGKIITSRIFNVLMRAITGLGIEDYFSGLKCFRANVIKFLSLYGDLYRFAAVFAYREGFKVAEIPSAHHPRASGQSKYSPFKRFNRAVQDIITVMFSITLSRKRAYYLGVGGLFSISIGLTLLTFALFVWGFHTNIFDHASGVMGVLFIFIGIQAVLLKQVADSFFFRHFEEFRQRQKNVKSILS